MIGNIQIMMLSVRLLLMTLLAWEINIMTPNKIHLAALSLMDGFISVFEGELCFFLLVEYEGFWSVC